MCCVLFMTLKIGYCFYILRTHAIDSMMRGCFVADKSVQQLRVKHTCMHMERLFLYIFNNWRMIKAFQMRAFSFTLNPNNHSYAVDTCNHVAKTQ